MLKISFDFDGVLAEDRTQKVAKKFIETGHDVWITTSRCEEKYGQPYWNRDLYKVAEILNIPKSKIQLTNGNDKWKYLKDFDIHFDDDQIEIELIEENLPTCTCVLIYDN